MKKIFKRKTIKVFLFSFVIAYFIVLGLFTLTNKKIETIEEFISKIIKPKYDFYESKKPTVDPVMVKELIDSTEKDYVIVDIRSAMEYKWSHMKGAINIPAYTDPNNVYQTQNKLGDVYKKVSKIFARKKLIIIYGYSSDSDINDKVYEFFKKNNLPVRIMSISWYEWSHNFAEWMPGIHAGSFDSGKYVEGNNNGISQPFAPPAPIAPIAPVPY